MRRDPEATIAAVLAGDLARFDELVRRFDGPVRRIVGRRLRGGPGHDEVLQEIWCRAFRQLARLGDGTRFEAWLGRIARNCVSDHFRRRRRAPSCEPLDENLAAGGAAVDGAPPGAWVWDLVQRLPPQQRDLILWRYREQQGYEQIAARLRVPRTTLRGRMYEARTALRRLLEREDRATGRGAERKP